jgi:ATP phosphoribosyltransferase
MIFLRKREDPKIKSPEEDCVMSKLKLVIPKGRIYDGVVGLLEDSGIRLSACRRQYAPPTNDARIEIKIMKPQNIAQLVELGSHDAGFTGYDWIVESGARVVEVMDLGLDPVKIVAAAPAAVVRQGFPERKIVIASEYENISRRYLEMKKFNYHFLRTYGATEAYPPQDADMIIDNTMTGETLAEHGLEIMDVLLESSTRFIACEESLKDAWKREKIEELKMLFSAVLYARQRVMLEMNVPEDKLQEIVRILPCMKAPTVSPLYQGMGYAVKAAVPKEDVAGLIPRLKRLGASDILEYKFRKVVL